MINECAETNIVIPGSDGVICTYGGIVVFDVTVENSAPPANDLLIYDNKSTGSGTLIAVIPALGPNQTYQVKKRNTTGLYVKNVSGWTGSIGLGS